MSSNYRLVGMTAGVLSHNLDVSTSIQGSGILQHDSTAQCIGTIDRNSFFGTVPDKTTQDTSVDGRGYLAYATNDTAEHYGIESLTPSMVGLSWSHPVKHDRADVAYFHGVQSVQRLGPRTGKQRY